MIRFYLEVAFGYNDGSLTDLTIIGSTTSISMGWLKFENLETEITIWTIRLSMICLLAALALRLRSPVKFGTASENSDGDSAFMVGARNLWLLGSLFSLLHALAAMGFYHQWSHWLAFEDTLLVLAFQKSVRLNGSATKDESNS